MVQQQNVDVEKQLQRTLYDAKNQQNLPGELVRRENDPPTGDPAVDDVYDALGLTYDFFWKTYQRNSLDDQGMPLVATVHYGMNFDNVFWNGRQLVIGDGDRNGSSSKALFNRFSISIDIIANQLVHGMVQLDSKLRYWEQPGALIESISDVFGVIVKQWSLSQTAQEADWIVGKGLFTSNVNGIGLRSMKSPGSAYDDPVLGKDPQPAHMQNYVKTTQDNGGVHINSGIPNRAFYLIATELRGYAWEKSGHIWYAAFRDKRLKTKAQFYDFASITLDHAHKLYGLESVESRVVQHGWEQVGIKIKAR